MANNRQQVLVIGLGNTLRGDDALGRIAAERLREVVDSGEVKVIDQCGPTPELAAEISAAALVVFLDASVDGPVGEVVTRRLQTPCSIDAMFHHLDPNGLLALAGEIYDCSPEAYAVTFRGQTFDFDDCQLSPEADAACRSIIQQTQRLIDAHRRGLPTEQSACLDPPNANHVVPEDLGDQGSSHDVPRRTDRSTHDASGG